ncbi:hypothetical protein [Amycolatopsis sp. NPDC004625]|uniref:hypothetical protein n=1 Tax=Amycolatopsis sp. NPDC004625 TaxID=3154670 RepID=UPI0033B7CF70
MLSAVALLAAASTSRTLPTSPGADLRRARKRVQNRNGQVIRGDARQLETPLSEKGHAR